MVLRAKAASKRGRLPVNASNNSEHRHSAHSLQNIPAKTNHPKLQPPGVCKHHVTRAVSEMAHPSLAAKVMLAQSLVMSTSWRNLNCSKQR